MESASPGPRGLSITPLESSPWDATMEGLNEVDLREGRREQWLPPEEWTPQPKGRGWRKEETPSLLPLEESLVSLPAGTVSAQDGTHAMQLKHIASQWKGALARPDAVTESPPTPQNKVPRSPELHDVPIGAERPRTPERRRLQF